MVQAQDPLRITSVDCNRTDLLSDVYITLLRNILATQNIK